MMSEDRYVFTSVSDSDSDSECDSDKVIKSRASHSHGGGFHFRTYAYTDATFGIHHREWNVFRCGPPPLIHRMGAPGSPLDVVKSLTELRARMSALLVIFKLFMWSKYFLHQLRPFQHKIV